MPHVSGVSSVMTLGSAVVHAVQKAGTGIAKAFKSLFNVPKESFAANRGAKSTNAQYTPLATSDSLEKGFVKAHNYKADPYVPPLRTEHQVQSGEAQYIASRCALWMYDGIAEEHDFRKCLNATVKLSPEYRREPLEHMVRAAEILRSDRVFSIANDSRALDQLPENERSKFDNLYAALLTRASRSSYYSPLTIEQFNTLADSIDKLAPELRSGPLKNLGYTILHLPDERTFDGYDRFRSACEKIPEEQRNGLAGIYEAGLNRNRSELKDWESGAIGKIWNHIEGLEASHDIKRWGALADQYGLTHTGKEEIRNTVIKKYVSPAVLNGANVANTLERHGLNDKESLVSVSETALMGEKLLSSLKTCNDYLAVANEYGIVEKNALKKMSSMADSFYQERKTAPDAR
ncbi:MAG TPA: hypothetical protein VIM98_20265 [Dyella sp.]|uniref:hypothetical protein n=1 Tax=Dyella sp. TaxID=1869338 RepID=UPI002F94E8E2